MSDEVTQLDLSEAKDCRVFLADIRVDGKLVTHVDCEDGSRKRIADFTDSEAIQYANQLHREMFGGALELDTHIDRGLT